MADQNLGDAVLTLSTDNSGVKTGMDDAKAIAEKGVADIGASFAKAGAALSLSLTAPIVAGFSTAFDNFEESATGIAKVEAGLASTGNAAGKSLEELQRMASGLQAISRFGDDEIMNDVTAQLLTFTKITGDAFDQAQVAVLDLSAKLDQDLKSSAIQVGKALNDPIAGVTALQRVGVKFTEDQKAVIEQLVKTGDVAGAQAIILRELNTEFGGTAEAVANVGKGPLIQLQNQLGDVTESFGKVMAEGLIPIIPYVKDFAVWVDSLDQATKTWIVGVAAAAAALGPLLIGLGGLMMAAQPLIGLLGAGGVAGALGALGTAATGPIGLAILAVTALGAAYLTTKGRLEDFADVQRTLEAGNQLSREQLEKTKQKLVDLAASTGNGVDALKAINIQIAELDVKAAAAAKGLTLTDAEVKSVATAFATAKPKIGEAALTLDSFMKGIVGTNEEVKKTPPVIEKAKKEVEKFNQTWIDFSSDARAREQALQNVIDLVGEEFASAIRDESLPALREIGAQLAYLKDRDAKNLAEAFKSEIPPAIQTTVNAVQAGVDSMIPELQKVDHILDGWDGQTKDAAAAFGRLKTDSIAELQKLAEQAAADFTLIKDSGVASQENITEAWRNELQAQVALMKAQGIEIPAEQQRTLDTLNAQLKTGTQQQKGVWDTFGKDVAGVLTGFTKIDIFKDGLGLTNWKQKFGDLANTVINSLQKPFVDAFNNMITNGVNKLIGSLTGKGGLSDALGILNFGGGGGGGSVPSVPGGGGGGGGFNPGGLLSGFNPINFAADIGGAILGYLGDMRLEGTMNAVEWNTRKTSLHAQDMLGTLNDEFHRNVVTRDGEQLAELREISDELANIQPGGGVTIQINGPVYGYSSVSALIADINALVRNDGVALTASELLA